MKNIPQALWALTERATPDHYRRATLMFADPAPKPLPPPESVRHQPVRPSADLHPVYPWQNLTFEGGGAKGYAYIGAIQALERAGLYPTYIRRIAGTSVGSMLALFATLGVSSEEMIARVPADLQALVMDGGGGRVGSMARTAVTRGMHPGQRAMAFLGAILEDYTGSADVTFQQLLDCTGRELCVAVTNVTRMMTEYCHPKTTPNMPVRVAIRMSMSLPVLLQPVLLQRTGALGDVDTAEVYVDGGVLCNNPSHAFDGWWLSMAPTDGFLHRVLDLDDAAGYYARSVRFSPINEQTLAFTLFSSDEADLTRTWVRPGGGPPPRPQTPEKLHYEAIERETAMLAQFPKPLRRLLAALGEVDLDADGRVSEKELARAVEAGDVSSVELLSIFGTTSIAEIFGTLNRNADGFIDFGEVVAFIQSVGGDLTTQLVGYPARPPRSLAGFAANLFDAVSRDLSRATVTPQERARTVPICTDYVTTRSFGLVAADLAFLIESAKRSTRAFLLDYDAQRAGDVSTSP